MFLSSCVDFLPLRMTTNDHYERDPPTSDLSVSLLRIDRKNNHPFSQLPWWLVARSSGSIHPPVRYYHYFSCSQRQVSPPVRSNTLPTLSCSILDSFGIISGRKQHDTQQTTCSFCVHTPSAHTIIRNQHSLGICILGKQSPIFTFLREIMQLLNTPVLQVCHRLHMSEIFNCLKCVSDHPSPSLPSLNIGCLGWKPKKKTLQVLLVPVWGFSRCLIFPPQPKTIRLMSVCVCVCDRCVSCDGGVFQGGLETCRYPKREELTGASCGPASLTFVSSTSSFRLFLGGAGVSFLHLLPHLNQTEHKWFHSVAVSQQLS